jgi:hypothetical protein
MFMDFCQLVGTKVTFTSVYHSQSNGVVGRANTLIFEAIKKILEGEKKDKWVEVMPRAIWSHNKTIRRAINIAPFWLLYRAEAVLPEEIKQRSLWIVVEVPSCSIEADEPRWNKGMERSKGQIVGARHRWSGSLAEPSHQELHQTGVQMGRALHGHRKIKTGHVPPLRLLRQDARTFLECKQPSPLFHLIQACKSEGLMNYKWAFIVVPAPCNYFQGMCPFSHWGSLQGCEVCNEGEPMYPEAVIKALFSKAWDFKVEIANKVSSVYDKHLCTNQQSHEQRRAIRPLSHWLKISLMKKEASRFTNKKCSPKKARGSKRPLVKKEASRFTNKKCPP